MTTHPGTEARMRALAADLVRDGSIRSREWESVFASVPRHHFVPRWYEAATDPRGITVWNERDDTDRETWLSAVYSDATLVTGLDPGAAKRVGDRVWTGVATSSSTHPGLMAGMLEDLRVDDGHRVLEIGTGTGYNAALLSARLGDRLVHSVDIAPELVEVARQRLAGLGLRPSLAHKDGRDGFPGGGRFDRIIATCSVPRLPDAWIGQLLPGGAILTDLDLGIAGGLTRFTPEEDGTVLGRFTMTTGQFMPARASALSYERAPRVPYAPESGRRPSHVTADAIRGTYPFRLLLAFALPRAELVHHTDDDGTWSVQLQTADGAWARVPLGGEPYVTEGGDGALWREVEATWGWWNEQGRPGTDRFAVVQEPDGRTHARCLSTRARWDLGG
ncbi:methyltransferase domain-containing protein [Streptomyces uncialis]|uniref:methyltransferase domain-containing protein n=1 Tax=Streptomyces uncialis TaxID=1048205 RepID=UPI00380207C7